MKKHTFLLLALTLLGWQAGAQQVERSDWQSLRLSFDVATPTVGATQLFGTPFATLELPGYITCNRPGEPDLPVLSRMVEVPLCGGYTVELSDIVADTIAGPKQAVAPCQPSRSKSDRSEPSLVMDTRLYATDAFTEAPLCEVQHVGVARSVNLAQVLFAPVRYNPVTNQLIVVRHATVTIVYQQPDVLGTLKMKEMYECEAFQPGVQPLNTLPGTKDLATSRTAPIHYLIVAHSSFRGQLDSFIAWKKRKGFLVTVGYTDETAVGSTTTSIANYVKSFYTNATAALPAPAYLLLVGDNEQIPAHTGQYGYSGPSVGEQITDLYYTTWTTGDLIPDCYCGRMSAQTVAQLTPQLQKTLMYEQYTFADPSFLDKAILIAGVDGGSVGDNGYTYGDPAMDYAAKYYVNSDRFSTIYYYKNNTSFAPTGVTVTGASGSNAAAIRNLYNAGAGWINYTAHGSETSWGNPQLTVAQVGQMTNTQKFGFMIGNCCLTGSFQVGECLGEALLRKTNYCGAVEYFGGSNSTYWVQDFYWSVGIRSSISNTMNASYDASHLGMYDCLFHTHNEARSSWGITAGGMMMSGTMAVQNSTASGKQYYWEIYHNFGDPSVMPWLGQAQTMTVQATNAVPIGTTTFSVQAVPYAYCALTDGQGNLVAAAFANASGSATLNIASLSAPGTYELAVSAQHYRQYFQNVNVFVSSGPYVTASNFSATLNAGQAVQFAATIKNVGTTVTGSLQAQLVVDNTVITLSNSQRSLSNIAAGDSLVFTNLFTGNVAAAVADQTMTNVTLRLIWGSGSNQQSERTYVFPVNAADVQIMNTALSGNAQAGNTVTLTFTDKNVGHLVASGLTCSLTSSSPYITVGSGTTSLGTLQPNATATAQYSVSIAADAPAGYYQLHHIIQNGSLYFDRVYQLAVGRTTEGFESGNFSANSWVQGSYPWTIVSNGAYAGTYCARSATITHSQNSDLTINWNVAVNDSISFWYKVSSEANYDKFHFYIDGQEMLVESGTSAVWTRAAYPVSAGSHTFAFSYTKDGSVSSGSDCAWIDNITFPLTGGSGSGSGQGQCQWNDNLLASDQASYYWKQDHTNSIYNFGERFANSDSITIDSIGFYAYIVNSATPSTSSVTVKIYSESASGAPDALLASQSITYASVTPMAENYIALNNPVDVTGNYFVVFTLNSTPTTDTFSILSTAVRTPNTAWVMYNNTWYQLGNLFTSNSAALNTTMYIYTHACPTANELPPTPGCDPIATLPWSENFNSAATSAHNVAGVLPSCWDGYTNGTNSAYAPHVVAAGSYSYISTTSPGLVLISGSTTYGDTKLVRLPEFSAPVSSLELSFWYQYESSSSGTLSVGYFTSDDLTSFVPVQTIAANTAGTTTSVTFTNVPATARYIGFKWYYTSSYYGCAVDDITVSSYAPPATYTLTTSVSPANSGSVTGGGTYQQGTSVTLTATPGPCYQFASWSDGSTQNPRTVTVNANMTLTARFTARTFSGSEGATACDSYSWHGQTYTTGGSYTWQGQTAQGCDSTATLNLTLHYSAQGSEEAEACDSYSWHGQTYTLGGSYTWQGQTSHGCDSTVTLQLTLHYSAQSSEEVEACDSYSWHGHTYTTDGNYNWHGQTLHGCDSTVTLHLTLHHSATSELSVSDTESYTWNGTTYTESGDYTWQGVTLYGCDSIVTLHLTIFPPDTVPEQNGIAAATTLTFSLFPNPAMGELTVESGAWSLGQELVIVDMTGRVVFTTTLEAATTRLNLQSLPTGAYLMRLGSQYRRLIIQR